MVCYGYFATHCLKRRGRDISPDVLAPSGFQPIVDKAPVEAASRLGTATNDHGILYACVRIIERYQLLSQHEHVIQLQDQSTGHACLIDASRILTLSGQLTSVFVRPEIVRSNDPVLICSTRRLQLHINAMYTHSR